MADKINLLELANALLTGGSVAKAAPPAEDPDAPAAGAPPTPGSMSPEEMEAARKEAASAQPSPEAAPGAAGDGGAEGGAPGGEGGQPQPEEEETPVEKAEILKSIHFLAETYDLSAEEIAKSFSGTEGDPTEGKEPVGKGIDYLEKMLKENNDILGRIASFLQELAGSHVKLSDQVAKSLEASEVAKSLAETTAQAVAELPKVAAAKAPKAATAEEIVAKAQAEGVTSVGGEKKLNGADLFRMALDPKCPLTPQQMAQANRASQGTIGS